MIGRTPWRLDSGGASSSSSLDIPRTRDTNAFFLGHPASAQLITIGGRLRGAAFILHLSKWLARNRIAAHAALSRCRADLQRHRLVPPERNRNVRARRAPDRRRMWTPSARRSLDASGRRTGGPRGGRAGHIAVLRCARGGVDACLLGCTVP